MKFKVHVPDNIRATIDKWKLPDEILVEVYERLDRELGRRPFDVLHELTAPIRMHQYSFSATHSEKRFTFVFAVDASNSDLVITDCWSMEFAKKPTGKTLPVVD